MRRDNRCIVTVILTRQLRASFIGFYRQEENLYIDNFFGKTNFFFLNREDLEISITSPLLSFVDLIYRSVRQVDLFGLNNFSDLNLYKFYIEFLSDLYMDGIYKYFFVSCFD